MSATLLSSPCKRTTGRPSPPPRRSLHALCKECDGFVLPLTAGNTGFNPRTPCGVRRSPNRRPESRSLFQSTHSLRSATNNVAAAARMLWFQSTHSLRSATFPERAEVRRVPGFNPRTPCGVRRKLWLSMPLNPRFQSTHSLRSATRTRRRRREKGKFQSTHSLRSATCGCAGSVCF